MDDYRIERVQIPLTTTAKKRLDEVREKISEQCFGIPAAISGSSTLELLIDLFWMQSKAGALPSGEAMTKMAKAYVKRVGRPKLIEQSFFGAIMADAKEISGHIFLWKDRHKDLLICAACGQAWNKIETTMHMLEKCQVDPANHRELAHAFIERTVRSKFAKNPFNIKSEPRQYP